MSVGADEEPYDWEDEEMVGPVIKPGVRPADRLALGAAHKYVARLFCGHVISGEIREPGIVEMGTHGAWCDRHEHFSLFEDMISTAPLTDRWGRP